MSVEDIHIPVMYEQLEDIQDDFDQVDVELSKFFFFTLFFTSPQQHSSVLRLAGQHEHKVYCRLDCPDSAGEIQMLGNFWLT